MKRITGKTPKNKHNNKMKLIIFLLLVFFLIVAMILLKCLPTIRSIEIIIEDKNSNLSKEEILNTANIKVGDKLYKYLRSEISKKIEENPYIKSVEVERELSGKVIIKVKERKPVYMVNYAGEYIYLDDEGYILGLNKLNIDIPIIIGFITDFSALTMGETKIRLDKEDLEKLEIINNIFVSLNSNGVDNKISSVDITDRKNFILILNEENKTVYLGDVSDLNTKILYMKKILQTEKENKGIIYINNNLNEGYVYFKEQE